MSGWPRLPARKCSCGLMVDQIVALGSAIHEYFKIQEEDWALWLELLRRHPSASLVLPARAFASIVRANLGGRARSR